jgi:choline dehydrogenase-like flavoprotein
LLQYRIPPGEQARIRQFRLRIREALRPLGVQLVKQAENNERLAHVCGTCRFGENAQDSVLDANNRAHGFDNLYVVDGSFFPSSAGTNPSLTIAANALRVADRITATPIQSGKRSELDGPRGS